MVIIRKMNTKHLSIEAYEQYGVHHTPPITSTLVWATVEHRLDHAHEVDAQMQWVNRTFSGASV